MGFVALSNFDFIFTKLSKLSHFLNLVHYRQIDALLEGNLFPCRFIANYLNVRCSPSISTDRSVYTFTKLHLHQVYFGHAPIYSLPHDMSSSFLYSSPSLLV